MSKFCGKCGAQLDNDARVCGRCGNVVSEDISLNNIGDSPQKKRRTKKLFIGVVATVAVMAVAIVVFVNIICSNSYKAVIDTYINSNLKNADATAFMELFPDEFLSYVLREENMSRREAADELQKQLDSSVNMIDSYYNDWSVSYEITDTHDSSNADIKLLSKDCEDLYGFTVSAEKEVTVEVLVSATVDGETKEKTQDIDITLIKVDNSWYLWGLNGSTFDDMLK